MAWVRANKRPKTARVYESRLKNLAEFFGGKMLSDIHPFLIEKYKQKRLRQGAKVAVNRELSRLRTLLTSASSGRNTRVKTQRDDFRWHRRVAAEFDF